VQHKAFRFVARSQDLHGITAHFRSTRDLGQRLAVRPAEPQFSVVLSIDLISLLVDGPMMPATEQGQIRERSRATLGPMADVMALSEPNPAAREAAAPISVVQRPA